MRITAKIKIALLILLSANSVAVVWAQQIGKETVKIETIDYQSLISKADLIYTKPPKRSQDGLPVGNGKMGSLIWTNPQAISYQINRIDVFSINADTRTFDGTPRDYCGGSGLVDIDFQSNEAVFTDENFLQHLF